MVNSCGKILMIAIVGTESRIFLDEFRSIKLLEVDSMLIAADLKKVAETELQLFSRFEDIELLAAPAYIAKDQKVYLWQDGYSRDSGFKKQKRFYRGQFFCKKIIVPVRT